MARVDSRGNCDGALGIGNADNENASFSRAKRISAVYREQGVYSRSAVYKKDGVKRRGNGIAAVKDIEGDPDRVALPDRAKGVACKCKVGASFDIERIGLRRVHGAGARQRIRYPELDK